MITQAKLDQLVMDFRALRRKPSRVTPFSLMGADMERLFALLPFFLDTRREHGLGDLFLSALMRQVRGETEPPPREVRALDFRDGLLRVETRDALLWVALAGAPCDAATVAPHPDKRCNAAFLLGAEEAPAPFQPLPWGRLLEALRRRLPAAAERADARWWLALTDWMTTLATLTGADAMKDLAETLKFYDRNREKIESLLRLRSDLAEESSGFAGRLEAKLRNGGVADGLTRQGNRLSLTRAVRVNGRNALLGLDVWVLLEETLLRVEPAAPRDASGRRLPAEEARALLEASGLGALAGDRRVNPENPEGVAYQTLKTLFQSAADTLAKLAK